MSRIPRGRQFFANPGPTNIPDSVLHALAHTSVDYMDPGFIELYNACFEGLKRVLKTKQHLVMYAATAHGAWEASLVNLLSPGDTVLVIETGHFSDSWAKMAAGLGLVVHSVAADWRRGADIAAVRAALAADSGKAIKAVCAVHTETATGLSLPIPEIRAALDTAGHPALLLVDTVSSLGCLDFRMDEWGVDAAVGGSQKGLMLPTGISFTGVSEKALAAHRGAKLTKFYLDWSQVIERPHKSFIGTVPINFFYGMQESLRRIEEEGLEQVFARHSRLAEAVRRCVRVWSANNGPQLYCLSPTRLSDSVTAVQMPDGHNADALRRVCQDKFNVSLGGGLARLGGIVFRIGHMGDLNEPMVLGTLGAVEMALQINGVPHGAGGLNAAMEFLAQAA